ncbi:uncharacterized protein LOC135935381 [Cloeon dipterum]|uniref:uncharacterized protein LOC135935381 n=1 Tax=Cloeon dipterum TaxID=197152 RepID=UPI00321FE3D8
MEENRIPKKAVNLPTKQVENIEDSTLENEANLISPNEPNTLGFWNNNKEQPVKNVCVLVVHYAFAGQGGDRSEGDSRDVQNLKETFAVNRKCKFIAISPTKLDFYELLANKASDGGIGKFQELFHLEGEAPDVLILCILSHGFSGGVILTENSEKIHLNEVFGIMKTNYLKDSFKLVFVSACRGAILDMALNVKNDQKATIPSTVELTTLNMENEENASAVAINAEPNVQNFVIVYSSVESTFSIRLNIGTLLIRALCKILNKLDEDVELEVLLSMIMNDVHRKTMKYGFGSTPQVQIFPFAKLTINRYDQNQKESGLKDFIYDWTSIKGIYMSRREAHIFCRQDGKPTAIELVKLVENNLGFDARLYNEYKELNKAVRHNCIINDSGCVMICILAPLAINEETSEISVVVNKGRQVSVQDFQYNLIRNDNTKWVGKPKICIFANFISSDTDALGEGDTPLQFAKSGTYHSGYLTLILPNPDAIELIMKELGNTNLLSGGVHLQQVFMNILRDSKKQEDCAIEPQYWSTLQYLLDFPANQMLVEPTIQSEKSGLTSKISGFLKKYLRKLVKLIRCDSTGFMPKEEEEEDADVVCLVSALPGMGKSLLTSHLAYKLRQMNNSITEIDFLKESDFLGSITLARVEPDELVERFSEWKGARKKFQPGKEIFLLDGFDGIDASVKKDVLQLIRKIADAKLPLWVTTRPHDEQMIIDCLNGVEVEVVRIDELQAEDQKQLLKLKLSCTDEKLDHYLSIISEMGAEDLLKNPSILSKVADYFSEGPEDVRLVDLCHKIVKAILLEDMQNREGLGSNPTIVTRIKKRLSRLKTCAVKHFLETPLLQNDAEEIAKINSLSIAMVLNNRIFISCDTLAQFLLALHVTKKGLEEESGIPEEGIERILQSGSLDRCRKMISELEIRGVK